MMARILRGLAVFAFLVVIGFVLVMAILTGNQS